MKFLRQIFCLVMMFGFSATQAQLSFPSNYRSKKIAAQSTPFIDSLVIVPNTLKVKGVDSSFYLVNYNKGSLKFVKKMSVDSVWINYRVFNFSAKTVVSKYNFDSIKNNFIAEANRESNIDELYEDEVSSNAPSKINYSGSFGRNISFGNNQNAVFNSDLNLQMQGYIGDSIELSAAITDNNIPIQPDGTTQRLNEFDKILIQFKKRNWQLSIGDVDLKQNNLYFLNFYKRLQGINFSNKNGSNNFNFTGAIAKGKFTRFVFNGLEGNQGPYRLQGANGETFFIVLAGTEKVFIDGELMKRGEDMDYVVNYNTGEILFTAKRMITKDKRIQVEFEYAERSYLKSMFFVSKDFEFSKKFKVSIAAYQNVDAKNSPINQQLDVNQKQYLSDLGNNFQQAFYPFATQDSFSTTKILYAKRPSPISVSDSIYVYSVNKDSAKYALSFLEVGANKGNYISLFNGANGKVYQWMAPVNNVPQGNYEPVMFLVTPKKHQIINTSFEYQISKKTLLKTDIAFSNYDVNTFSSLNKNENKAWAGKLFLQHNKALNKSLNLSSTIQYELIEQNFKPVERLRTVEFARNWGLPIIVNQATEHLPKISLELTDKNNNYFQIISEGYYRNDNFNAYRQSILHEHLIKGFSLKTSFSYTINNTPSLQGYFLKPNFEIAKTLKRLANISIGANYLLEHNAQKNKLNDTLTNLSFGFENISLFIKSNPNKQNKIGFTYFTRSDKLPIGKSLEQIDRSHNYGLQAEFLSNDKRQLRFNFNYRQLQIINQQLTNQKSDNTLLSRIDYSFNEFKGFANGYFLYEIGAGQEQRRDFSYVEVPAGRGLYTWNDYNADGIAQLNEFEVSPFIDQAKYIRIFTPTNQFIKANYNTFNYNLNLSPKVLLDKNKLGFIATILSNINLNSSLQINNKTISNGNIQLNPFAKNIGDTSLIQSSSLLSNTLSVNRSKTQWGIDFSNIRNNNKSLLTYGLESRQLNDWIIKLRYNFLVNYTFELVNKFGSNQLSTPSFSNRNFDINYNSFEPKIMFTSSTNFRLQASYIYSKKSNSILLGGENSANHSLIIESKFINTNNTSITAKFNYSNVDFVGTKNTTISFIMLDGLQPGKNYLWNLDFTKRLKNNFELSLNYEGRKVGESKFINIGRASLRAIF